MSEVYVLRSAKLDSSGFIHGFSTRIGGVSDGPYASLNLGRNVNDQADRVAENHQRFAAAIGYSPTRLFDVSQVHGCAVVTLLGPEITDEVRVRKADALVVREPGRAVGVRTADCVPVLIGDTHSGAVAAVHAGWRGIVAGIVAEALAALESEDPATLVAAIGPSIGPCCFEVGQDVALSIAQAAGDGIVINRGGAKPHVDLRRAVEHQLRSAGVGFIDTLNVCTMCDPEKFYSYRRDGSRSGRMLSVIVPKG